MYVVQCPKCQHRLKVKSELHQAKIRCSKCSAVFIADSQEVPDSPGKAAPASKSPPAKASRPAAPSGEAPVTFEAPGGSASDHYPVRPRTVVRRKNMVPTYIMIGVLVVVVPVLIYSVWFFASHTNTDQGWMTNEELAAKQAKAKEEAEKGSSVTTATPPSTRKVKSSGGEMIASGSGDSSASAPAAGSSGRVEGDAAANVDYAVAEVVGAAKDIIGMDGNKVIPDGVDPANRGLIVGSFRNKTSDTLKLVDLTFEMLNDDGQVIGKTDSFVAEYVPPADKNNGMKYSVQYNCLGKKIRAVAKVTKAEPDVVSFMIDAATGRVTRNGSVVQLKETFQNLEGADIKDVSVYVNFITNEGQYIGNKTVKLEDNKTVLSNEQKGRFTVEFNTKGNEPYADPNSITEFDIRIVGKK